MVGRVETHRRQSARRWLRKFRYAGFGIFTKRNRMPDAGQFAFDFTGGVWYPYRFGMEFSDRLRADSRDEKNFGLVRVRRNDAVGVFFQCI